MTTKKLTVEAINFICYLMTGVLISMLTNYSLEKYKKYQTAKKTSSIKRIVGQANSSTIDVSEGCFREKVTTVIKNINYSFDIASTGDESKFIVGAKMNSPDLLLYNTPISFEVSVRGQTLPQLVHKIKQSYRLKINLNDINKTLSDLLEKNGQGELYAYLSRDSYTRISNIEGIHFSVPQNGNEIGFGLNFDHVGLNLCLQKQGGEQTISWNFNLTVKTKVKNKAIILDKQTSNRLNQLQKKQDNSEGKKKKMKKTQPASLTLTSFEVKKESINQENQPHQVIKNTNEYVEMPNVPYTPGPTEFFEQGSFRNIGVIQPPQTLARHTTERYICSMQPAASMNQHYSASQSQEDYIGWAILGFACTLPVALVVFLKKKYGQAQAPSPESSQNQIDSMIEQLKNQQGEQHSDLKQNTNNADPDDGSQHLNWLKLIGNSINTPAGVLILAIALGSAALKMFGPPLKKEANLFIIISGSFSVVVVFAYVISYIVPKKIIILEQKQKPKGDEGKDKTKVPKTPNPEDPEDGGETQNTQATQLNLKRPEVVDMSSGTGNKFTDGVVHSICDSKLPQHKKITKNKLNGQIYARFRPSLYSNRQARKISA